jgi:hypothetical protein
MKIEITILGLLMEGNLYGYEVKKKIIERLEDYVDIKFGSIYYALRKAVDSGWVRQTGVEKEAAIPSAMCTKYFPRGAILQTYVRKYLKPGDMFQCGHAAHVHHDHSRRYATTVIEERNEELESRARTLSGRIAESSDENEELLNRYLLLHVDAEKNWLDMVQLAHDRNALRADA